MNTISRVAEMLLGFFLYLFLGSGMTIRYSWRMTGLMILGLILFSFFAVITWQSGSYVLAFIHCLFALACIYGVVMCFAVGEIDEQKIWMRLVWGAMYQMSWDEVNVVKLGPSHIAFSGNGKWVTVPIEGVQNAKSIAAFVEHEVARRKIPTAPFRGLEYFRLFKNSRIN